MRLETVREHVLDVEADHVLRLRGDGRLRLEVRPTRALPEDLHPLLWRVVAEYVFEGCVHPLLVGHAFT